MKSRRVVVLLILALLLTSGFVLIIIHHADEKFRESEALYTRIQASNCVATFAARVVFDAHLRTYSYPADQSEFDELLRKNIRKVPCNYSYPHSDNGYLIDAFGDRLVYSTMNGRPVIGSRNDTLKKFGGGDVYIVVIVLDAGPVNVELNCDRPRQELDEIGKELCENLSR